MSILENSENELRLTMALSTKIITMGGSVTNLDSKFIKGKVYGNTFSFNGKTYHLMITDKDFQK